MRLPDHEFLLISPRALHLLAERLRIQDQKQRMNSAWIEAAIYNVNRDFDKRPEPYSALDFMPEFSACTSESDQMKEFVLAAERGEFLGPSEEELLNFKDQMHARFAISHDLVLKPAKALKA